MRKRRKTRWLLLCLKITCQPQNPHPWLSNKWMRFSSIKDVDDQGIDSPWNLASHSDEDINAICDMIKRSCGSLVLKYQTGSHISVLVAKNLKLVAFLFKMMEHCSRTFDKICQQHRCAEVPASIGTVTKETRWYWGAQVYKNNWEKITFSVQCSVALIVFDWLSPQVSSNHSKSKHYTV